MLFKFDKERKIYVVSREYGLSWYRRHLPGFVHSLYIYGDGLRDDNAFNEALEFLPKNPGGKIQALEGRFSISSRINITKSFVTLEGQSPDVTIFILADGADDNIIRVTPTTGDLYGISLKHFSINGNKANQSDGAAWNDRDGIYFEDTIYNFHDVSLFDIKVTGVRHGGAIVLADVHSLKIVNVACSYNGVLGAAFACDGLFMTLSHRVQITNVEAIDNTDVGLVIGRTTQAAVDNVICLNNIEANVAWVAESIYGLFSKIFSAGSRYGFLVSRSGAVGDTSRLNLINSQFINNSVAGVNLENHDNVILTDCIFAANAADVTRLNVTNARIRNNSGYVTEASGTDTIPNLSTFRDVTHNLSATPTIITIAFREPADNDYGRWWVSAVGPATFRLNVSANPGASNLDFFWEAKVR